MRAHFPYLEEWWQKYQNQGLEIIAIHTPEFAFEKDSNNVTAAAKAIRSDFSYRPRQRLLRHGTRIRTNIGRTNISSTRTEISSMTISAKADYDQTEAEIVKQLNIFAPKARRAGTVTEATTSLPSTIARSMWPARKHISAPMRNEYFGNGTQAERWAHRHSPRRLHSTQLSPNTFYLGGTWDIEQEYAQADVGNYFQFHMSLTRAKCTSSRLQRMASQSQRLVLDRRQANTSFARGKRCQERHPHHHRLAAL